MVDHQARLAQGWQVVPWLLLLTAMAWSQGMIGVLAKTIAIPAVAMVCVRCVVASVVLWSLALAGGRRIPSGSRAVWGAIVSGMLLAAHWATLFVAYTLTDIALVVVGVLAYPLWTAIAEPFLFKSRFGWSQLAAAVLVVIGVAVLDPTVGGGQPLLGFGLAVFSGVIFAARNLMSRALMAGGDGIALMAWQTTVSALVLSPWLLDSAIMEVPWPQWRLVIILGILFTALPHTVVVLCMDRLTVTTTGIIGTQQVIAGILYGWLLLSEPVDWQIWLGAAIVITGVLWESIATWYRRRVGVRR